MTGEADRLAQCRREFEQALEMGCTIPELRAQRERDRVFLRQRAGSDLAGHTDSLINGPSMASQTAFQRFEAPWMMRE